MFCCAQINADEPEENKKEIFWKALTLLWHRVFLTYG